MIPLYFDPGTGALIVQFFAAAVAGFLMFYRTVMAKVKSFFGIKEKYRDDFMDDGEPDKADDNGA
jgi:hypothetical protein